MANEYATLAQLKAARRISTDDTGDDDALNAALTAASRAIDTKVGRRFYLDGAATARTYRPEGRVTKAADGIAFAVDDIGSASGLIVELGAGSSFSAVTDYEALPDNALAQSRAVTGLLRAGGWGSASTRLRVTAKWGWPAVPDEISQATLLLASRLFTRRDSPEGVLGSPEWATAIRVNRWDPDVLTLVQPYMDVWF